MAKDINPPRGMRDFLPVEKAKRDRVLGIIRGTYRGHGYQEIETPALEDLGRLTSGQGGDNEKLAYRVMKRGEELERALGSVDTDALADLGLRFDLTVPLTRYYATNFSKLPRVFKAIQTGPVWRAERPQKGRYRQFVQCDIDIIGDVTNLAEVDLLVSSLDALKALGLNDAVIRVNDKRILGGVLTSSYINVEDEQSALIEYDKLDKKSPEEIFGALSQMSTNLSALEGVFKQSQEIARLVDEYSKPIRKSVEQLQAINDKNMTAFRNMLASSILTAKIPDLKLPDFSGITDGLYGAISAGKVDEQEIRDNAPRALDADLAFRELNQTISTVEGKHPGKLVFDPTLVRGMGYYTGTIFEISHPASGSSIGGGGRYDGMVGRWTGNDVPAVGISLGFERVVDLVSGLDAVSAGVVLVLEDGSESVVAAALRVQADLIALGHAVRLELRPKKLNLLLESMVEQGFTQWASVDASTTSVSLKPLA